jgi:ABC-2 type transport system permease protein
VSQPGTLLWLASQELRLSWRDWVAMMTVGHRRRVLTVASALIVFAGLIHLLAYSLVRRYALTGIAPDQATLVVATSIMLLSLSPLLSQAMELVTRVLYSRSDLDLILASPVSPRRIFSVRIGRIAVEVTLFAMLLATPFINVLAVLGGARWLATYGVAAALGAAAAAIAVALTVALFRTIGAKRTRLIAQIAAAVIGAVFVIGLQIAAILSYGSLALSPLQSAWLIAHVPDLGSPIWWPARALLGDPAALILVAAISIALLGAVILIFAPRLGDHVVAAASVSQAVVRRRRWSKTFRRRSVSRVLRQKEWTLLGRDPWLMSQVLMQILYLLPAALFLWHSFHSKTDANVLLVPMMVMAAGHLGGNLAWLSISGEDAPDLVATAPVSAQRIICAKIEAVMGTVAFIFAPLVAALAFLSVRPALVAGVGVLVTTASATLIQLCFRTQARRSQFRHRQVSSSRIATFAEAISSIAWAAISALAAAGTWFALFLALIPISILGGVWLISSPDTQAHATRSGRSARSLTPRAVPMVAPSGPSGTT